MTAKRGSKPILPMLCLALIALIPPISSAQLTSASANQVSRAYAPLWRTSSGYSSVVTFRNGGTQNATATVHLYSAQGQENGSKTVSLPPGRTVRLNISKAIPGASTGEGGLAVDWSGDPQSLSGHVELATPSGTLLEYPLQGGYAYDTEQTLSSPWWLPDSAADGTVTLFNTSSKAITVTPSISVAGQSHAVARLSVAPNATHQIQLRSLLSGAANEDATTGSITLSYTGAPHALQPAMILSNSDMGFSLMSRFGASHSQPSSQMTNWQFPAIPMAIEDKGGVGQANEAVTSFLLLSNNTRAQLTPKIVVYSVAAGQENHSTMPVTPLAPSETRLINLSQTSGENGSNVGRIGLTVSHAGQPGDLGMTIFGMDSSNQVVSEPAGGLLTATALSNSFWDISSGKIQFQHLSNKGGGNQSLSAIVSYQADGTVHSYTLPGAFNVGSNEDKVINVAQITRLQAPDSVGNKLPAGVRSGFVALNTTGNGVTPNGAQYSDLCQTSCLDQPAQTMAIATLQSRSLSGGASKVSLSSIGPVPECTSPTQPPPPEQPSCGAILYYRRLTGVLTYIATHSFWYIQDSVGNQLVIDGGPSVPHCGIVADPNCQLVDWTYLAPTGYYPQDNIYTATPYWSTLTTINVCPNTDQLESYAQLWPPSGPIEYRPTGPNSNSFARAAGESASFIVSPAPPRSVGWSSTF
jgi:hypothetical protein